MAQRVTEAHQHLQNRFGQSIMFHRVKNHTQHHETGESYTYWEEPTITCTAIYEATTRHVQGTSGVVHLGDRAFVFAASDLTEQTGTDAAGRNDTCEPNADDYITYDGRTYKLDLGGGTKISWRDPTQTLWTVWARERT